MTFSDSSKDSHNGDLILSVQVEPVGEGGWGNIPLVNREALPK